jgi:phosphoribosylformylglycinamidine synthase subunit PurQ / glutaminase
VLEFGASSFISDAFTVGAAVRFGVVVFPGTNCDQDTLHALQTVFHQPADPIWHESTDLAGYDCVILPGGFAHGDYLRAGAIARFSPVMAAVERFARADGLVWGICNGFQVLLEAGLLPGAMQRNASLRFRCDWAHVRVEHNRSPYTASCQPGQVLRLPIAHGEGNYFAPPDLLARLEAQGQILLRYCDASGAVTPAANPNGSAGNVAGLASAGGNVFALMPHPERASEALLGGTDGRWLFESVLSRVAGVAHA